VVKAGPLQAARPVAERKIALFAYLKLSDDFYVFLTFEAVELFYWRQSDAICCSLPNCTFLVILPHTGAPVSVWGLSVWPLRYQQEWHCNCEISQNTSLFCVCRLLPLLLEVLYNCLMTVGPQHNKYKVVLHRKCERLFVDTENPNGMTIVKLHVFFSAVAPKNVLQSATSLSCPHATPCRHCSHVTRPYCLLLMQTHQFKFTLINALVLKSTKLLFEIVNFSIYQKSIRSGPCFKSLLSPFWSLSFQFYNSNMRRTSGQDLGAF